MQVGTLNDNQGYLHRAWTMDPETLPELDYHWTEIMGDINVTFDELKHTCAVVSEV